MKVFATLATVLGASSATQLFHNQLHQSNNLGMDQHSMKNQMRPSMSVGLDRHMDSMNPMASGMRDMYRDNQQMDSNMMNRNIMDHNLMGQETRSQIRDMHRQQNQGLGPNQYFVKDDFGNYVYSYNDQQSEKSEEGNNQSIKGHYAYIMSNGIKRRVDYVADNQGFHLIRDNADPARIKRSVEPDFIKTRMTSVMDSSSLRDNGRDMYKMSNMMGGDMSSSMGQRRYSNMMMDGDRMGQESMDHQMMGQNNMGRNMMGRKVYNIMSNKGMTPDMSNMMRQQMDANIMGRDMMGQESLDHQMMGQNSMGRNMIGRNVYNIMSNKGMTPNMMGQQMGSNMMGSDMTVDVMGRNMMGQDRTYQMKGRNMMDHQDVSHNMMDMSNDPLSSNSMSGLVMKSNMNSNNRLMGHHMMQKMEIERVPETYTSTRFF